MTSSIMDDNNNNNNKKKMTGKAFSSPFSPRLPIYQEADSPESKRCCFCNACPERILLYTRKQIYVCPHCSPIVDAIMETNHK